MTFDDVVSILGMVILAFLIGFEYATEYGKNARRYRMVIRFADNPAELERNLDELIRRGSSR